MCHLASMSITKSNVILTYRNLLVSLQRVTYTHAHAHAHIHTISAYMTYRSHFKNNLIEVWTSKRVTQ